MLIHYLREKNDVITNVKGSYLSSTGPLRGVLVSDAAGRVGWSKWNEKSEKREWVIDHKSVYPELVKVMKLKK